MSHPYGNYIENKAAEYYGRQAHEPHCETLQPYKPCTDSNGFVYDVHIIQHCDCWLTINFDRLTLARKFDAMRALSHRIGLHSAACSRLKTEKITYRGKPEILNFACDCWLSVPVRQDPAKNPCPVCDKPLFFAPRAPQDTAKQACSDLNCVNAHGIVDFGLPSPVDYSETHPEKENTMPKPQIYSNITLAKGYASAVTAAQFEIDDFLVPFVRQYTEFLAKYFPQRYDHRDFKVDHFVSENSSSFYLTGDEEYSFGEMYVPSLDLPFDFVADPEAYKARVLKEEEERKNKIVLKKKADAQEKVDKLKAQLAKAEEALAKAAQNNDPISTIATRNQAQKLAADIAIYHDKG